MPVAKELDNVLLYDDWGEPYGEISHSFRFLVRFNLNNQQMDVVVSGASVATIDPSEPLQPAGYLRQGQLDCKRNLFDN